LSQAVLVLALLGPPSEEQQAAISAYEHTRQVRLEARAPASEKPRFPGYDARLVAELEAELDAARTRAASLDETQALELLAKFESKLLAHPELPQSAWLLAERHRLGAEIAARSPALAPSAALQRQRALVLEGVRAPEFGEPAGVPERLPPLMKVGVEGLDARDRLELDGRAIEGRALSLPAGQHHVRVMRSGQLVFASWVTLGVGASALRLSVPAIVACSAQDFAGYRVETDRGLAAPGTRCSRWVLAAPARRGLRFADCFADRCGPFVTLPAEVKRASLPPQPDHEQPSRALVNAAVIGGAVLAGTAVMLWQSGTFDEAEPGRTRWIYGGATPAE
jgi:hypothetical protein